MKLYATTTSDQGGREAKKGGDEYIETIVTNGNKKSARLRVIYDEKLGITYFSFESFLFGKWYLKGSFEEYENISENEKRNA